MLESKVPDKNQLHFGTYYIHTIYNTTSEVIRKLFKFFFRQDYLKAHPIPVYLEPRRMASYLEADTMGRPCDQGRGHLWLTFLTPGLAAVTAEEGQIPFWTFFHHRLEREK